MLVAVDGPPPERYITPQFEMDSIDELDEDDWTSGEERDRDDTESDSLPGLYIEP